MSALWRWAGLFALGLLGGTLLGFAMGLPERGEAAAPERAMPSGLREDARAVASTDMPVRPLASGRFSPPLARAGRPRIAVVIDDLGLGRRSFERANALPAPVTLAFLPYGEDAQAMLDAVRPGHEAILHLPTEPLARTEDAGPDMLRPGEADEVLTALEANLGKLEGYAGVNNHTGSLFTADPEAMTVLLRALHERGLYFLDSVTTTRPVAGRLAAGAGWRVIERDVFLDSDRSGGVDAVKRQLRQLEEIARAEGAAVAIGHPYPATMEALGPWLVTAQARGFELVTAGELAGRRTVSARLR